MTTELPSDREDELGRLMIERFIGRRDVVGLDDGDGIRAKRLSDPMSWTDVIPLHIAKRQCVAVYPVEDDGTVRFTCVDFDNKEHAPDPTIRIRVTKLHNFLVAIGLPPTVEISQGGRGFHLWLFFSEPIDAAYVRAFWCAVFDRLNMTMPEVFPKQSRLDKGKIGNCIRLPLYGLSHFIDVARGFARVDALDALRDAPAFSKAELASAAAKAGLAIADVTVASVEVDAEGVSPVIASLLENQNSLLAKRWNGDVENLRDTSRSSLVFSIASALIREFVSTNEIRAAIKAWCRKVGYERGDRDDWVEHQIAKAYERTREQFKTVMKDADFKTYRS